MRQPEIPNPAQQLILIREKVDALEQWRSRTEADLREIHDVISQVKLLISLSIGGGGLSILTLLVTVLRMMK
jgi:hypothetical protein